MFNAFRFTELGDVKVVILGQDPYHGPGSHMVWRFPCVRDRSPPSLVNMYKELEASIPGFVRPAHGYLESWARGRTVTEYGAHGTGRQRILMPAWWETLRIK